MKPELKQGIQQGRKVVANLRDITEQRRLILADIDHQADILEKALDAIETHGGGTGTE